MLCLISFNTLVGITSDVAVCVGLTFAIRLGCRLTSFKNQRHSFIRKAKLQAENSEIPPKKTSTKKSRLIKNSWREYNSVKQAKCRSFHFGKKKAETLAYRLRWSCVHVQWKGKTPALPEPPSTKHGIKFPANPFPATAFSRFL